VVSMMNRSMSMPVAPVSYEPTSAQMQQGVYRRQPSFLPAHLNMVPEEMWSGETEDFLMNLVDEEDWAIGVGLDMDAH
jgi:hypothetical protein